MKRTLSVLTPLWDRITGKDRRLEIARLEQSSRDSLRIALEMGEYKINCIFCGEMTIVRQRGGGRWEMIHYCAAYPAMFGPRTGEQT